ncbi:hypothetical protein ACFXPE_11070 [Streptomyces scopuliridis]|uniref:hypothetical protein n=1 Tax=Streptomyces scopuliridis TaxID=452529 RepID=UPI00368F70AD
MAERESARLTPVQRPDRADAATAVHPTQRALALDGRKGGGERANGRADAADRIGGGGGYVVRRIGDAVDGE